MSGLKRHMARDRARHWACSWSASALLMLTGAFTSFSFWLLDTFPALARIG